MGTQLGPILVSKEIKTEELSNKKFAVDSFNVLYQFITTIRQQDGTLLTDSKGRITSHLSGIFFRSASLMKNNLKLAFVFDGTAPDLKKEERERRSQLKQEAKRMYEEALSAGDIEKMKKYAGRTAALTKEMIEEAKELIIAMGMPVVQAPSEGEAQASYMAKKGDVYALISQDTDGLLFGSPKIIKNLSVSRKKKKQGTSAYESVSPELVSLTDNLNNLGIDIDQLIVMGILCGTDFNVGGVKGIGPKKAHGLVKKYGRDFESLFKETGWEFNVSWQTVFSTIKNMPVTDDYDLKWGSINEKEIYRLLVEKYEFSKERIQKALDGLVKNQAQKGLGDFF